MNNFNILATPSTREKSGGGYSFISYISTLLKTIIVPRQMGAGTAHKRRGDEEFRENSQPNVPHMVRSTVAERETREVMASGMSVAS